MTKQNTLLIASIDAPEIIERRILQRTAGRIDHLAVELLEDRVIIRGQTPTYYAKQLAIACALESIEASDCAHAIVDAEDVQVGPPVLHQPRSLRKATRFRPPALTPLQGPQ